MEVTTALVRPPIVEVVCGVRFRPIPAFDTLRHGLFWSRIRDRYPRAEVHPILTEPTSRIVSDVPLQRSWFVTPDEEFVIQVQLDRFYVNWRKRSGQYPRFMDERNGGVFGRFEREYDGFRVFLRDLLDTVPTVEAIELSKVDVFERPSDWADFDDLARMIPRLNSVLTDEAPNLNLALAWPSPDGVLQTVIRSSPSPTGPRVHAEFRLTTPVGDDVPLSEAFVHANDRLNATFFAELPDAARRFGTNVQ